MLPQPPEGGRYHVGNPVELSTGERGTVQLAWSEGNGARYAVLLDTGTVRTPLTEAELRS